MPVAIREAKALVQFLSPMSCVGWPACLACGHGETMKPSYPEALRIELR
jgi:hypothetical protein